MRKFIIAVLLVGIYGCKTDKKNVEKEFQKTEKSELDGTWGLTNYFDTIVKNKKIAEYRSQEPAWFAMLLGIKNDSISSYGSIFNDKLKLKKKGDTLIILNGMGSSQWVLTKGENQLNLRQVFSEDRIDSTSYIYRKREDLNHWLEKPKKTHKIWNGVTNYFNKEIIAGKYLNTQNEKIVNFKGNGELVNFNGFKKYEVRNYFGTLHPHKNMDVLTLTNPDLKTYKQYNWKFNNGKLTLTEFVHEVVYYKGKKQVTDDFVLGKGKIELIKK